MSIAALPSGTVLNPAGGSSPYRIERVLGRGGFAITYLAEWLGAQVAIKEYLPEDFAMRGEDGLAVLPRPGKLGTWFQFGLERFEAEARTLLQLKDAPSIAKALNYFTANDTAYLVMDFVVGRTLEQLLYERGALPEPELRNVLELMVQSLAVVHARGYLHRDIKPANIVMSRDGRPVLVDFGAAREALLARTQMLTVILSPGYAPFEQYNVAGSGPYSDLYSLGATLYRAILPDPPRAACQRMVVAQATDRVAALQAGRPDPLEPAVRVGAGRYSAEFLQVLDWMLEVWPANRPPTAQALLERLQAGAGKPMRSKTAPYSVRPRWRVDRNMVVGLALIALAGVITLVGNWLNQPMTTAAPKVANLTLDQRNFWRVADADDTTSEHPESYDEPQRAQIFGAGGSEREMAAAALRPAPAIRGVQLGISYAQVEQALGDQALSWQEDWKVDPPSDTRYFVSLSDGALLMAQFASPFHERRLMALYYEQRLANGPTVAVMLEELAKKYGAPDRSHDFRGGKSLTWWLCSVLDREPKGAVMRARLEQSAEGRVTYLRLSVKDVRLHSSDIDKIGEARDAARRVRQASEGVQSPAARF